MSTPVPTSKLKKRQARTCRHIESKLSAVWMTADGRFAFETCGLERKWFIRSARWLQADDEWLYKVGLWGVGFDRLREAASALDWVLTTSAGTP